MGKHKRRIACQRKDCDKSAKLYVAGSKGRSWHGYFCYRCSTFIIKLRMPLIKKYEQFVIMRPITDWDRQQRAKLMKRRKR